MESLRAILALSAQHGFKIRQIDIVGAFLNGYLDEEIYMNPPKGLEDESDSGLVWQLVKALYGLKQSGRVWNQRIHDFLTTDLQFIRVRADPCIYIRDD